MLYLKICVVVKYYIENDFFIFEKRKNLWKNWLDSDIIKKSFLLFIYNVRWFKYYL